MRAKLIKFSAVEKCRTHSMDLDHYRRDGSCKHTAPTGVGTGDDPPEPFSTGFLGMFIADDRYDEAVEHNEVDPWGDIVMFPDDVDEGT